MKVGLSGGIACGKSTVLGFFREAGWQTVDSDAVVRELLATDAEVKAQLSSRWGEAGSTTAYEAGDGMAPRAGSGCSSRMAASAASAAAF